MHVHGWKERTLHHRILFSFKYAMWLNLQISDINLKIFPYIKWPKTHISSYNYDKFTSDSHFHILSHSAYSISEYKLENASSMWEYTY